MPNYNLSFLLKKFKVETDKRASALKAVKKSRYIMGIVDSLVFMGFLFTSSLTLPYFIAALMITALMHKTLKVTLGPSLGSTELQNIDNQITTELSILQGAPSPEQSENELTSRLVSLSNRKSFANAILKLKSSINDKEPNDEDDEDISSSLDTSPQQKLIYQIKKELKLLRTHIIASTDLHTQKPEISRLKPGQYEVLKAVSNWLNQNPKRMFSKINVPSIADFYIQHEMLPHFQKEIKELSRVLNEQELDYANILLTSNYKKENFISLVKNGYKLKDCDLITIEHLLNAKEISSSFVNSALVSAALNISQSFPGPAFDASIHDAQRIYLETIWNFAKKHNLSAIDDVAEIFNMPKEKDWIKKSKPQSPPTSKIPTTILPHLEIDKALPPNSNISSYNGMFFDFESTRPEVQKLWNHTVEILNYFDTNSKALDSLPLEHQMSIKQVKTLTLPQLNEIYKSVQQMPLLTKAGLLNEVEHTLTETHALLVGIMNLTSDSVLREVQGLKLYAKGKRHSLG